MIAAGVAYGGTSLVTGHHSGPKVLTAELTANTDFTITSTISNSPTDPTQTVKLLPGVKDYLFYTVSNPFSVPITVTSMSIASTTPPTNCPVSPNLDLSQTTFSGTLTVPAAVGLTNGSATESSGQPITLVDTASNQTPGCANQTFNFTYAGTATYTDSTSTSLASSSPGNTSTSGTSVTFTATVTGANASSDSSGPTGTVIFYDCPSGSSCTSPTSTLGTGTVGSNGQATLTTSTLPVGNNYIEAVYSSSGTNGNYTGSTSSIITQVVTSGSIHTSTSLTSAPNPSSFGFSVTFTATVSAASGTPGGTVTFYNCTTNTCGTKTSLGTGTLGSGKATYATSALPVGTTYVEAIYGASGNDAGSTSNVVSQVVNAISTSTSLTSAPNPSSFGSSVTFTATVSAASGTPGGTVTFYNCTTNTCGTKTSLGTGTLGSGKATYATSALPVGTTYVEAIYGASGNDAGSTSNVVSQVVNAISTSTSLTSAPNPSSFGSSVTFTATVSAASGTPGGTVTFYNCTTNTCGTKTSLGTGTLGSGKATYATSALPVGTTYVEAIYGASGNDAGSTSNVVSQVVNAISTSTSLTSAPNPSSFGFSVTFTATVSAASGTPGGTVTFYNCTTNTCGTKTSLGTGTLGSGKATYATSALPVGTTYVEAIYGASGNDAGSTSNVVSQVVNAISTSTSLTSAPNPSSFGTSVTFTATVSAASGTPGGTVTFYNCTTNTCGTKTSLGTGTLGSGKATYATSALPVGTTYVEAIYGASGNDAGSTSNVVSQVVLNVPSVCASGGYNDVITGTPANPFLYGTNDNDLIYAFGASYWINGLAGNDCIDSGDGNNVIFDGNGNDGVAAGNGSDSVILGNGSDQVSLGNGSDGVNIGDGNDTVTVGSGSDSGITVGNGNDTATIGTGSYNDVNLGSGTDTVTIQGSHDDIDGGAGNEMIYLGSGTYNSYSGQAHHTNVCHLPVYNGKAGTAAEYHDTITNCTVVSP